MRIETRHFDSAAEFVNELRRSDPYWLPSNAWRVSWIFRGQSCDQWRLIPCAWRDGIETHEVRQRLAEEPSLEGEVQELVRSHQYQALELDSHLENLRTLVIQNRFELYIAQQFAGLVDELGLPLPGGPLPNYRTDSLFQWIDRNSPFHPTIGLAQHHGTPTRLLDWTHNPLIAAFFAAEKASDDDGNVIVWAANRKALANGNVREFTVQRSQIGFLHSQEGLFTYAENSDFEFLKSGRWPCMEDMVPAETLRRLTLPKREAPALLRLLWAERISRAHLMPTLDNVSHALKTVWKYALRKPCQARDRNLSRNSLCKAIASGFTALGRMDSGIRFLSVSLNEFQHS